MGIAHKVFLQNCGHDCDRVTDENLSSASDDRVWEEVCLEKRFFITLDLDFSDIRKFPPGSHPGVLLLRPRSRSAHYVLTLLTRVVNNYSLESFQGCLVVADEITTRIRRP